ncbi:MAG: hypothetical protein ACLFPQ_02025, partial [Candidatus Woesearchaeota archaeon]
MKKILFFLVIIILVSMATASAVNVEIACGDLVNGLDNDGILTCPAWGQIWATFYISDLAENDNMFATGVSVAKSGSVTGFLSSGKYTSEFMESNGATAFVTAFEDSSGNVDTVNSITGTPNPGITPFGSGYAGQYTFSCTPSSTVICGSDGDLEIVDTRDLGTTNTWWQDTDSNRFLFEDEAPECIIDDDCNHLDTLCGDGVCNAGTCEQTFKSAGTQCRESDGLCDVAETCTGTSAECP